MKNIFIALALSCHFVLWAVEDLAPTQQDVLLNHIIRQQLTRFHFDRDTHPIDDDFSKEAFALFIKRVDSQKRLMLQSDVDEMKPMLTAIDDDFNQGQFHLPAMAEDAVEKNLVELIPYCGNLLKESFDYDKEERFETDPEKMEFCATMDELKERWRLHLKYQCLGSYLSSLESEKIKMSLPSSGNLTTSVNNTDAAVVKNDDPSDSDKEIKISPEKDLELREKARKKTADQVASYFKRLKELNHQEHYSRYFNAITAGFDPHTNYMDPATKEDFSIRMSKSLQGIGAVLQEEDDFTKIVRIVPGSASYRQGELKAGDIILRVAEGLDGEELDITGMRLREVVTYIRGEKGTIVRLTVKKSDGKIKVIPIERDIVKLEDALAKSTSVDTSSGVRYGYIYLPDFYRDVQDPSSRNCTDDVRNEIFNLKKQNIQGLIFDLRGNGGGFLEDARTIAGLFIESGPIVQVKDHQSKVQVLRDDDGKVFYDGPMVVLVDQFSASASEILAAALQDYNRAVIVGSSQTHGKGTVQHLLSLDQQVPPKWKQGELGNLKLTIQKFYRINGGSTQIEGVHPDIVLPDDKNYLESGERHLEHALPWDSISAVKYRPWGNPFAIDALNDKSQDRVKKSEIFSAIALRGERLEERYKNTVVTLSREAMIKERDEAEAEGERYKKIMDDLKAKLDPVAFAKEKELEEAEKMKESEKLTGSDNISEEKKPEKTPEEMKAEEYVKWQEGVRFDPYVRESMHILDDMVALSRATALKN